jgi:hypothetical protein
MLKKIWQSFMRWVRKTFGRGTGKATVPSHFGNERVAAAELPPLDDTDREYLFMQLLEGVAHGWQQPRAIGFFNKIRQRVRKSEWLEWLDKFGNNLLEAPVPNYELAGRMVQLGQLDCGEIGDLAGEYGFRLLNRQSQESIDGFQPIMEFDTPEFASDMDLDAEDSPYAQSYGRPEEFSDVPPELLLDLDPSLSPPPRSFQHQTEEDAPSETREITLEEFSSMLYKDPNLVAELAEQFGIETTDPEVIINTVIAQMQQQVQISGDLSNTATESVAPPPPPAPETPHQEPHRDRSESAQPQQIPPPPPPTPKLEYKADDPWSNSLNSSEEALAETINSPDRGV